MRLFQAVTRSRIGIHVESCAVCRCRRIRWSRVHMSPFATHTHTHQLINTSTYWLCGKARTPISVSSVLDLCSNGVRVAAELEQNEEWERKEAAIHVANDIVVFSPLRSDFSAPHGVKPLRIRSFCLFKTVFIVSRRECVVVWIWLVDGNIHYPLETSKIDWKAKQIGDVRERIAK